MRFLSGIRGRVLLAVLAASALAYSAAATLGFLRVANASRDAMRERIGEVLDALEGELRGGVASARASTPDGVEALVVPGDATLGGVATDEMRVVRRRQVGGTEVVLVGRASSRRLGESLRALHRGLWTAVPVAVVLTALLAAVAIARTLRPVADITRLAATIGSGDARQRVPVPDTTDEIEALARTVNGMLDRIGAGVAAQRQFTSDAAHELRTPLMALAAEIELAARPGAVADPGLFGRLAALADRLATRVDDLVLLSSLDEAPPPSRRHLALAEVARTEAAGFARPIELELDDAVAVEADEALVARAVRNLVANACRHASQRVRVTVAAERGRAWVHVDDDGSGIPAAERERAFSRFGRLDAARAADAGGAGLGLAIVASVASRHGGGAQAEAGPLGGARVSFWLPAAMAP